MRKPDPDEISFSDKKDTAEGLTIRIADFDFLSAMSSLDDHTTLFRRSWSLYDAITAENYMFHRELYSRVSELLNEQAEKGPYSILDLGCGNARFLGPCLRAAPPRAYTGVDLSEAALEEAAEYLKGIRRVSLKNQDMLEAAAESAEMYEVIFTGYALHHLSGDAKKQFFQSCASRLVSGGKVIMVDVLRGEEQNRDAYIDEYVGIMRNEWTAVRREHIAEACVHVAAHDFPETFTVLARMAEAAGLGTIELLDRHTHHHLIVFSA